jgi:serine/threonine protein kinase
MPAYGLPTPGDVIAQKYRVELLLGRGAMGAVYAVTHLVTRKRLALKCLLPDYQRDEEIVMRFQREARAAGSIQHRHVVDVFDVGYDGELIFIVMAFLEGQPLSSLLRYGNLTLERLLTILVRAMEGVACAHDQGIVHRDLKPDNIFVCPGPSGELDDPRVLDFGVSKSDRNLAGSLTQTGTVLGTPQYMSLEQLSGLKQVDQRTDVYSIGVILYEALARRPPFVAENTSALAVQVLTTTPAHLRSLRPDLPVQLADAVMKAIARQADDRFASMRAFIEAIAPFQHVRCEPSERGAASIPSRDEPSVPPHASAKPRGSRAPIGFALLGLGVGAGLAIWWFSTQALQAPHVNAPGARVQPVVVRAPPARTAGEDHAEPNEGAPPQATHPVELAREPRTEEPAPPGRPAPAVRAKPTRPRARERDNSQGSREPARASTPSPEPPAEAAPSAKGRAGQIGMEDF